MEAFPTVSLVGSIIQIVTEDGNYEGKIFKVIGNRVILDKVVVSDNEQQQSTPLLGVQTFFKLDILSWKLIEKNPLLKANPSKIVKKVKLPPTRWDDQVEEEIEDKNSSSSSSEDEDATEKETREETVKNTYQKEGDINWKAINGCDGAEKPNNYILPKEYRIIDEIDDNFHTAMKEFESEKSIGVNLYGENIGRSGELHWLTISTGKGVFLFDIFTLENQAFDQGLRNVLESKDILKVFHDTRFSSDLLFHCYSIDLVNVIDTLAADIIYHTRAIKCKALPERVRTQGQCVQLHLGDSTLMHNREFNEEAMSVRPLQDSLRIFLIRNVSYLRPLWFAISEQLQKDLTLTVDIFLRVMRDAPSDDLVLKSANRHVLPTELNVLISKEAKYLRSFQQFEKQFENTRSMESGTLTQTQTERTPRGGRTQTERTPRGGGGGGRTSSGRGRINKTNKEINKPSSCELNGIGTGTETTERNVSIALQENNGLSTGCSEEPVIIKYYNMNDKGQSTMRNKMLHTFVPSGMENRPKIKSRQK